MRIWAIFAVFLFHAMFRKTEKNVQKKSSSPFKLNLSLPTYPISMKINVLFMENGVEWHRATEPSHIHVPVDWLHWTINSEERLSNCTGYRERYDAWHKIVLSVLSPLWLYYEMALLHNEIEFPHVILFISKSIRLAYEHRTLTAQTVIKSLN